MTSLSPSLCWTWICCSSHISCGIQGPVRAACIWPLLYSSLLPQLNSSFSHWPRAVLSLFLSALIILIHLLPPLPIRRAVYPDHVTWHLWAVECTWGQGRKARVCVLCPVQLLTEPFLLRTGWNALVDLVGRVYKVTCKAKVASGHASRCLSAVDDSLLCCLTEVLLSVPMPWQLTVEVAFLSILQLFSERLFSFLKQGFDLSMLGSSSTNHSSTLLEAPLYSDVHFVNFCCPILGWSTNHGDKAAFVV